MYVPTLDSLLALEQKKIKVKNHYNLDNKAFYLNSLLGFYMALSSPDDRKRPFINSAKEIIDALNAPLPQSLSSDTWIPGTKRPRIGLRLEITSKHNLAIYWTPLDYENNTPEHFKMFSAYKQSFQRPENELCFIHDVENIDMEASVSKPYINRDFNVKDYLETLIAQQSIEGIELLMASYMNKLEEQYEVWILNKIDFVISKEPGNINVNDNPEKISMLKNLMQHTHLSLNKVNFERPEITSNLGKEHYFHVKKRCEQKINDIKQFNTELSAFNLDSTKLVDTIKNYKRKSTRVAEVLSQTTGKTVTVDILKYWIDKMHEFDPETNIHQFTSKPAFMDMVTTMNIDIENKIKEKANKIKP